MTTENKVDLMHSHIVRMACESLRDHSDFLEKYREDGYMNIDLAMEQYLRSRADAYDYILKMFNKLF